MGSDLKNKSFAGFLFQQPVSNKINRFKRVTGRAGWTIVRHIWLIISNLRIQMQIFSLHWMMQKQCKLKICISIMLLQKYAFVFCCFSPGQTNLESIEGYTAKIKDSSIRNCLGQFLEYPWNQTTDEHWESTLITRVITWRWRSKKPC